MIAFFQEPKERLIFWIVFYAAAISAWIFLVLMSLEPQIKRGSLLDVICLSSSELSLIQLSAMWMLMMGAMMVPSFQSHIQIHMDIMSRFGNIWPTIQLILGYTTIWLALAVVGALMQQVLVNVGLVDASGRSMSLALNGVLCFAAAYYQFSPWKKTSLKKCASPMHYFFQHWANGPLGGLKMGIHLGLWCASCCWALMLLAFVGGTMNAMWMAFITALVVFEKYMPQVQLAARFVGQTLLCLGVLMFILLLILE